MEKTMATIDLRNCKPGDKLRIRTTEAWKNAAKNPPTDIVTYVGPLPEGEYYDHEIEYSNGSKGTRNHDGSTYRTARLPDDPDVLEIL